jgi:hypothetical protein
LVPPLVANVANPPTISDWTGTPPATPRLMRALVSVSPSSTRVVPAWCGRTLPSPNPRCAWARTVPRTPTSSHASTATVARGEVAVASV